MPVIGTAGHVDHGKSTLVQALTGRDPDRWQEEKERGLTIDLGFAWTTLPSGVDVSFVDVPGHERFIKNMLAGIEAIDIAVLVVAADEGWMPQTEEHAVVLDLLGAERAVIALTKVDRVDSDLAELAVLEVEERIEGLSIEGAEIIGVSAPTGQGLERLLAALDDLAATVPPVDSGRPRLWVDRSFSITGAGTVVTGTLTDGSIAVGDEIAVWPGPATARVRGIQSHEKQVEVVAPGNRVALNISGDRNDYARGSMIGRPDQWRPTRRAALDIRRARYVDDLTNRGAYHLHTGSGAWPVTLRLLDERSAIIDLPEPLCLQTGDRFILRETGRRLVVGGGTVLDPHPPRKRRDLRLDALRLATDPDERAGILLGSRGSAGFTELAADTGGGRPRSAVAAGGIVFDTGRAAEIGRLLTEKVTAFHQANPLREGMPLAEAASSLGLPFDAIAVLAGDELRVHGATIARADHTVQTSDSQSVAWQAARVVLEQAGPLAAPRIGELGLDRELLHALIRSGDLVRVSEDFAYLPEYLEELVGRLRSMQGPFTVSEFKDMAGLSRKYAVPFLEWADANGHTVRSGDRRRLRG
ncbi:MAG: selenocysteine-specific translation elongation factor [Acidimicrobiia bacterium]|nr:selenocysteine-specific translation elongation factor [Acidimicrobiia bacterium]